MLTFFIQPLQPEEVKQTKFYLFLSQSVVTVALSIGSTST